MNKMNFDETIAREINAEIINVLEGFGKLFNSIWDPGIREDVFQVITYMHIQGYEIGGFVYPSNSEKENTMYPLSNNEGIIYTIPFNIPVEVDYGWKSFQEMIQQEEYKIRNRIYELCNNN